MSIIDRHSPRFAKIDTSASGATELVAARTGKRILVLSYVVNASGAVGVKFQSASTDLTGTLTLAANQTQDAYYSEAGYFQTVAGEALNINLSGAVQVGGHLTWVEI